MILLQPRLKFIEDIYEISLFGSKFNQTERENFHKNYQEMIIKYAVLAESLKVEIFSVGYMLSNLTRDEEWENLTTKVRQIYSGKLIYQDKLHVW